MYNDYTPVFVLSTGRSGSLFIHNLFSQLRGVTSYHEAFPTLQYFSNFAYHSQDQVDVLEKMFQAVRMELILDAFNSNNIYVESNQCLTFFAPAIAKTFRKAKFIHLVRHPGAFVRSAIMKGWHRNDTIWESGRLKMQDQQQWDKLNIIEKLAWVWNATNEYIKRFAKSVEADRIMLVKLEDMSLNVEKIHQVISFTGIDNSATPDNLIKTITSKPNKLVIHPNEPDNMRKIASYPLYDDWSVLDKDFLKKHTQSLASYYSYAL